MPRTTIDLDGPVLRDLKKLQKREGKTLGQVASELLSEALRRRSEGVSRPEPFRWRSRPMRARVDLEDKEALNRALDSDEVLR